MSTNFLQWDPNGTNAESDSLYQADSLRAGGASASEIFPSATANKLFLQVAGFVAAFCTALTNKGYSPMDTSPGPAAFATLVTLLMNVKTSADFAASMIIVPYASSITFNAATASGFDLTLTGNVSASTLANQSGGQYLTMCISQDATGGRTFVWPSGLNPTGPICSLPLSTSVQLFQVRPGGNIIPLGPMIWITASGFVMFPTPAIYFISTSGTVSNAFQECTEVVNCSAGNVTRSLYSAIGCPGFKVNIKRAPGDTSANQLIVQPLVGGQTIDGFPNFGPIPPYNSLTFESNGADWIVI